jgi:bisphosphoglycerate-dependent phosphoglycerate mutase
VENTLRANTGSLLLMRHGESEWNAKGLFAGWVDVPLTPKGEQDAANAGRMLVDAGLRPDVVFWLRLPSTRRVMPMNWPATLSTRP